MQFGTLVDRFLDGAEVDDLLRELTTTGNIATIPLGMAQEPVNVRRRKKRKRRREDALEVTEGSRSFTSSKPRGPARDLDIAHKYFLEAAELADEASAAVAYNDTEQMKESIQQAEAMLKRATSLLIKHR